MSVQIVHFSLDNIDDANGLDSVMTALKNIDGVLEVELEHEKGIGVVHYDDTQTSVHAFKAAVSMVDYVTQPFPEDSPQNPDNL